MPVVLKTLITAGLALTAAAATAAPDYACRQVGDIKAAPPLIPESFRIDECSSFAGGPDATAFGKNWCEQAGKVAFGPNDAPPKVTRLDACPKGALALCTAQVPNSSVVVSRYFYIADRGAGGLDGLRRSCEGRKRKDPTAVFTVF